jgi:hypothetical protein
MKNLYNYNQFLNEGLFDWIKKMIGNAWEKNEKNKAKLKHKEKIKKIQDDAEKIILDELAKLDIGISSEGATTDSANENHKNFLNEAEGQGQPTLSADEIEKATSNTQNSDDDAKKNFAAMKSKMAKIEQIVNNIIKKAELKVDALIEQAPEKEKAGFRLEKEIMMLDIKNVVLRKQLEIAEKAGDKGAVKNLADKLKANYTENDKKIGQATSGNADKEKSEIDVDGQKFYTNTKYRYKGANGEIKTIKVTAKSDKKGMIKAQYVSKKFSDNLDEQDFQIKNIEKDFKPEKDKVYKYYSSKNDAIVNVKILSDPNQDKVKVKIDGTDGKEFEVMTGGLI